MILFILSILNFIIIHNIYLKLIAAVLIVVFNEIKRKSANVSIFSIIAEILSIVMAILCIVRIVLAIISK